MAEAARELGISATSLRRWMNEYDEYEESAFPGHGNALFNSEYKIKKIKNEILKKLQAFWKQKSV